MPTPDESMLNPFTDCIETDEQKTQRIERENKFREMLGQIPDKEDIGVDCGDQSCRFAISRTGMRTNGGCRCRKF